MRLCKNVIFLFFSLCIGLLSSVACAENAQIILAKASKGGAIEPSGKVMVVSGEDQTFRIAPINPAHYELIDVQVDGDSVGVLDEYTFSDVTARHSIAAKFKKRIYNISFTNSMPLQGKALPAKALKATYGKKIKLSAKPKPGVVGKIFVDGKLVAKSKPGVAVKYLLVVSGNHEIRTEFTGIAKIVVSPTSVLLSGAGQSKQLIAHVYDFNGALINVPLSWSSSHSDQISADSTGLITSNLTNGSSTITVSAEGVSAVPVVAVSTRLPDDASLVSDNQIKGDPVLVDPDVPLDLGSLYQVRLANGTAPPVVGEIMVGTGEKPVAGKVAAVETLPSGELLVTLEMVTIDQVFPELVFNEKIDLSNVTPEIPDDILANYDVSEGEDGSTVFAPKTAWALDASMRAGAYSLSSFLDGNGCERTGSFTVVPAFQPQLKWKQQEISYEPRYDFQNGGFQKLLVKGSLIGELTSNVSLNVTGQGSIDCKTNFITLPIPMPPALSFYIGGDVLLGAGISASGNMPVQSAGWVMKADAGANMEVGIVCPNGTNCEGVNRLTPVVCSECGIKATVPPGVTLIAKLEETVSPYIFARIEMGARIFDKKYILADAKGGLQQNGSYSPPLLQMDDATYKSAYELGIKGEVTAYTGAVDKILEIFSMKPIGDFSRSGDDDIAFSPKAKKITVDKSSYKKGDKLKFHVTLDSVNINFTPFFFNVGEVQIFRKGENTPIATAKGVAGQTEYDLAWTSIDSGDSKDNFYAFVNTKLMPIPLIGSLELGVAEVSSGSGSDCPAKQYYPSGKLEMAFECKNGVITRILWYYDNVGNTLSYVALYAIVQNPDGSWISVLDGVGTLYYEDGKIQMKTTYVKKQKTNGFWQVASPYSMIELYNDDAANTLLDIFSYSIKQNAEGEWISEEIPR